MHRLMCVCAQVFEPYMGLKRGRLIGASAVPVIASQKVSSDVLIHSVL